MPRWLERFGEVGALGMTLGVLALLSSGWIHRHSLQRWLDLAGVTLLIVGGLLLATHTCIVAQPRKTARRRGFEVLPPNPTP
jgi:hypothetical protein